jgi:hypothetical protein
MEKLHAFVFAGVLDGYRADFPVLRKVVKFTATKPGEMFLTANRRPDITREPLFAAPELDSFF